jgi:hypothetical protein
MVDVFTIKQLDPQAVEAVAGFMKGKKREKFLASVQIINESLEKGGWVPRGSVKAFAGFQGLGSAQRRGAYPSAMYDLYRCVQDGSGIGEEYRDYPYTDEEILSLRAKAPVAVIRAWVQVRTEAGYAYEHLNACRPLPKITQVGLSPRVTTTLKEANLDIDLSSIRMADLDFEWVQVRDKKTGEPKVDGQGKLVMTKRYFVVWSEGIVHGTSRFAMNDCEACGRRIPSHRFVPIEAHDQRGDRLVSLWVGCDCASNIFGVKDVGIEK